MSEVSCLKQEPSVRSKLKPLFSSLTDEWRTPESVYEQLDSEFHFNYDPCPMVDGFRNIDGLGDWKERNFINPPYSKVKIWIKHGYEQSLKAKLCVFLVAARTDTTWFHDYVLPFAKEVRFIRGRLNFSTGKFNAPFPSCIIIFDGRQKP